MDEERILRAAARLADPLVLRVTSVVYPSGRRVWAVEVVDTTTDSVLAAGSGLASYEAAISAGHQLARRIRMRR